jgi:hypothetical protein
VTASSGRASQTLPKSAVAKVATPAAVSGAHDFLSTPPAGVAEGAAASDCAPTRVLIASTRSKGDCIAAAWTFYSRPVHLASASSMTKIVELGVEVEVELVCVPLLFLTS